MLAYGEGKQQVEKKHVALAAEDTVGRRDPGSAAGARWPWMVAAAGVLMAAGSVAWAVLK
jgi:MSHA biogenesis protein MshM